MHLEEVADAEVDRRIDVEQQLRGVAAAQRLVALLAERDAARVGDAGAEAEARAHASRHGRSRTVELEVGLHLPEVVLQVVLLVLQQADEAGEVEVPAGDALIQFLADLERTTLVVSWVWVLVHCRVTIGSMSQSLEPPL